MDKFKGLPRKDLYLRGLATGIGSLPYSDASVVLQKILKYLPEIPYWPQLPKRNFRENMYVQFSEGFPGIVLNESEKKVYVDENKFSQELESFYQKYLTQDIDYFAISSEYASGLHMFYNLLKEKKPTDLVAIKGQITGPLTFGLAVKDKNGRSIFYNEQIRDALVKFLQMKALWQIRQLPVTSYQLPVIIFLDEPYLAAYGSAYTAVSREGIVNSLNELISGIRNSSSATQLPNYPTTQLLIGVHCCANTDWSIVLDTDIDILSFDAYEFFDSLVLYRGKVRDFVQRGGILAWGIVPTSEKVHQETVGSLGDKLFAYIDRLTSFGIKEEELLSNFLITPSCGLGTTDEKTAEQVLSLSYELSKSIRETL